METLMPLKAKYRLPGRVYHRPFDPPQGTACYQAGSFTSKSSNSGVKGKLTSSLRPRRRAWGPY